MVSILKAVTTSLAVPGVKEWSKETEPFASEIAVKYSSFCERQSIAPSTGPPGPVMVVVKGAPTNITLLERFKSPGVSVLGCNEGSPNVIHVLAVSQSLLLPDSVVIKTRLLNTIAPKVLLPSSVLIPLWPGAAE